MRRQDRSTVAAEYLIGWLRAPYQPGTPYAPQWAIEIDVPQSTDEPSGGPRVNESATLVVKALHHDRVVAHAIGSLAFAGFDGTLYVMHACARLCQYKIRIAPGKTPRCTPYPTLAAQDRAFRRFEDDYPF